MRWDAGTFLLLAVAVLGLAISVYYGPRALPAAALGAALGAAAGFTILLRAAWQSMPRRPRARLEPPVAPVTPLTARLDRDTFARRQVFEAVATLRHRVEGLDRTPITAADAERICALPTPEFRAWVNDRLDELEAAS